MERAAALCKSKLATGRFLGEDNPVCVIDVFVEELDLSDLMPRSTTSKRRLHVVETRFLPMFVDVAIDCPERHLDGDQHRRGDYKKQGDCIEGRVEGNHGGLTNDDPVQ